MYKYILLTLSVLCFASCSNDVAPTDKDTAWRPDTSQVEITIDGTMLPGGTLNSFMPVGSAVKGDTLFVIDRERKSDRYQLHAFSIKDKKHIRTLSEWQYKEKSYFFDDMITAVAVSDKYVYVGTRNSKIEVFDVQTLNFVTRIGDGNWDNSTYRMVHVFALAVSNGQLFVRDKERIVVYNEQDVTPEDFQRIPRYSYSETLGYNTNFNTYDAAVAKNGRVYFTDYEKRAVQVVDPATIKEMKAFAPVQVFDMKERKPKGIALHGDNMYVSFERMGVLPQVMRFDATSGTLTADVGEMYNLVFGQAEQLDVKRNSLFINDAGKRVVRSLAL